MKNSKIYKIVLIGIFAINLPFILSVVYLYAFVTVGNRINFLVGLFLLGYCYWSFIAPWYRKFSIKKINNKNEYHLWKKLSIYTMLLWPESFLLNQTEFWNDKNFQLYKNKIESLS
jgi:hypothetical protein